MVLTKRFKILCALAVAVGLYILVSGTGQDTALRRTPPPQRRPAQSAAQRAREPRRAATCCRAWRTG
jgi:hypothetical protein